jgi:hypothetical protein
MGLRRLYIINVNRAEQKCVAWKSAAKAAIRSGTGSMQVCQALL